MNRNLSAMDNYRHRIIQHIEAAHSVLERIRNNFENLCFVLTVGDIDLVYLKTNLEMYQKNLKALEDIYTYKRKLDAAKAMAEVLVLSNPQESKIQIFFHETGPAEGIGNAQLLYEWTGRTGLALRYDLRLPPPTESLDQSFPASETVSVATADET